MANRNFKRKQALESEVKDLYVRSVNTAGVAATATLATTSVITLTQVQASFAKVANNGYTFKTVVNAAAANPTNTILFAFTGTAAAIVCTITPNDGTNNAATPVVVTEQNLVDLINTGLISGKNPTITDASSLRVLNTATVSSGTHSLLHSGNGDNVTATMSGGVSQSMSAPNPSHVGIDSVSEVGVGTYRIALRNHYAGGLKAIDAILIASSAAAIKFQVKEDGSADSSKKYVDIYALVTGTPTNLSSSQEIMVALQLKNTLVI